MTRIARTLSPAGALLLAALGSGCALLGGSTGDGSGAAANPAARTEAPPTVGLVDAALGYRIALELKGQGFESSSSLAIVGDSGDAWLVETESSSYPGYVMGLTVSKETGRVKAAKLGKPGELGKQIPILPAGAGGAGPGTDSVAEELTIGIGSFASRKSVTDYGTSWVGSEGELADVILKYESKDSTYELARMPETEAVEVGGRELTVVKLIYSNDTEYWRTKDKVVASLNAYGTSGLGTVKSVTVGLTTVVTEIVSDAKPQLAW